MKSAGGGASLSSSVSAADERLFGATTDRQGWLRLPWLRRGDSVASVTDWRDHWCAVAPAWFGPDPVKTLLGCKEVVDRSTACSRSMDRRRTENRGHKRATGSEQPSDGLYQIQPEERETWLTRR